MTRIELASPSRPALTLVQSLPNCGGVTTARRQIRVGLAGCGVVGSAFVKLLRSSSREISERHGWDYDLKRVLVRDASRARDVHFASGVLTSDASSFLAEDFDVVVEATGNTAVAGMIANVLLKRGKKFITANKELIASAGPDLQAIAQEASGSLDFGASVGGSAPVVSLVRDLLGTTAPSRVRGILNGTSNFLLSQMEGGLSFEGALASAQRRGFAESDPSRDLDGRDAAAKLGIICWICYGIAPADLRITRVPLTKTSEILVQFAAAHGGRVRVIADCSAFGRRSVVAAVEPTILAAQNQFAKTEFEDNRVEVDLGWSSPIAVSGPGAGGVPTATALLSDLLSSGSRVVFRPRASLRTAVTDVREHSWLVAGAFDPRIVVDSLRQWSRGGARLRDWGDETSVIVKTTRAAIARASEHFRELGIDAAIARIDAEVVLS